MSRSLPTEDALVTAFEDGLGGAADVDGLGPRVLSRFEAAVHRFGLEVDALVFARDLGRRVAAWKTSPQHALDDIRTEEVFLCLACALGSAAAQEEFERSYLTKASSALHRLGLDQDQVDELEQQLRLRALFPGEGRVSLLDRFHGKGRLSSWLKVSITQMARRYLARRQTHEDLEGALDRVAGVDPELSFVRQEYRPVFLAGLREAVAALEPKRRFILAMNVVDGVSADRLARMYNVHRATIFRWLDTARSEILASTRAHVLASLDISRTEFDKLAGTLLSQLDVSLVRYLAPDPER